MLLRILEPKKLKQRLSPLMVLGALLAVLVSGCEGPEDLGRPPTVDTDSFGSKFFTMACQRVAYTSSLAAHQRDPSRPIDVSGSRYRLACRYGPQFLPIDKARLEDPKVAAFFDRRQDFIEAIDLVFPGNELADLQAYMVGILDLTDDGSFPAIVQKTADVLDLSRTEPELNKALARLESRLGYRPRSVCLGILREALSYPQLKALLDNFFELVGKGGKGEAAFDNLVAALAFELRSARRVDDPLRADPIHPGSSTRSLRLALDLLFTQDPAFASGHPRWLVTREWRGLARVRRDAAGPVAPFVDTNKDGLPDVDPLGYFVTAGGQLPPAPFHHDPKDPDNAPARDGHGRALDASGTPLYEYLDLDRTLLGALARDAIQLLDPARDTLLKTLQGLTALLGPRKQVTRTGLGGDALVYSGFDSAASPLLDLAHAVLALLRDPAILPTLEGVRKLFVEHEPVLARTVAAARRASDIAEKYPTRKVEPTSTLYDELFVLLRQLVDTPGLLEDVLDGMKDPRSKNLDQIMANYFKHRDVHVLGSGDKVVNQSGGSKLFTQLVDRTKPDTGSNRSIQQRLFHVIHDTNGMRMCNKEGAKIAIPIICDIPGISALSLCTKTYKACDLFEVTNGAVFYLKSFVYTRDSQGKLTKTRKAHLRLKTENMPTLIAAAVDTIGPDLILRTMTGISSMAEHPPPEALNRLMFMEKMPSMLAAAQDFPKDIDGEEIHKTHQGTLYSWEIPHPGMSCSNNDPCTFYEAFGPVAQAFADHDAEKLLMDIMSVLHRHWSSKQSGDYQYQNRTAPNFSHGSNVVSYEAAIVEIMEKGDLLGALRELSKVATTLKVSGGGRWTTELTKTARFLFDPARTPGLAYRDGRTTALWSDGVTPAAGGVSPIYLLTDAWKGIDTALDGAKASVATAWREATQHIVDVFLGTEAQSGQGGQLTRFSNQRIAPAARLLLDFVRARILAHSPSCSDTQQCVGAGVCLPSGRCTTRHINDDTAKWAGVELPADLERILAGPLPAAAADFVTVLREEPKANRTLSELLRYLVDEINYNEVFSATLTGLGDVLQLLLDDASLVPLAQALGKALAPEFGLVESLKVFLKPALARDGRGALTRILRNSVKEQSPGVSPMETLFELSKEMHRVKPGTKTNYTAEDYGQALKEIRDFLGNQQTGLLNFFDLIENRCAGPCSSR
jgi:hypothetical protein